MVSDISDEIELFLENLSLLPGELFTAQRHLGEHVKTYPRQQQLFNISESDPFLYIQELDIDEGIASLSRAFGLFGTVKQWLQIDFLTHDEYISHLIHLMGHQPVSKAQRLIEEIDRSKWSDFKERLKEHRRSVIRWAPQHQLQIPLAELSRFCDGLEHEAERLLSASQILEEAYEPMRLADFRTGGWFLKATKEMLNVDTLRKAGIASRISRKKQGKDWIYPVNEVKKCWPNYAKLIDAAIHKEESAGI